jgi:hypothetical protein
MTVNEDVVAKVTRKEALPFCELSKMEQAECKLMVRVGKLAKVKFGRVWWVVPVGHPLFEDQSS